MDSPTQEFNTNTIYKRNDHMSNTVIMLCVKIFSPNRFHMKCGMSTFKMHIIYNYNSVTSELFPSMWNGKKNKL